MENTYNGPSKGKTNDFKADYQNSANIQINIEHKKCKTVLRCFTQTSNLFCLINTCKKYEILKKIKCE